MRTLARIAVVTCVALVPSLSARAQGVTTFDGTYQGVSTSASGGRMCVPARPVPLPMTIKNGVVQWAAGLTGDITFQGTVNAQGVINAKGSNAAVFTGKIENGRVTGGGSGAGGSCSLSAEWRKQ